MRGMHPETQPASPSLPDYRTHPRAFLKALFDAAVHSAQPSSACWHERELEPAGHLRRVPALRGSSAHQVFRPTTEA